MEKRNDILLFVQDRATRENNIKGRIDLRDFGALTVGDSISLWESDFITKDEDGDTVEMSGRCVYDKVQENGQWGTFWVGETKYTFTDLETIALDRDELYDAFLKAYKARRNAREKRFGSPEKGRGDIKNGKTGIEECL